MAPVPHPLTAGEVFAAIAADAVDGIVAVHIRELAERLGANGHVVESRFRLLVANRALIPMSRGAYRVGKLTPELAQRRSLSKGSRRIDQSEWAEPMRLKRVRGDGCAYPTARALGIEPVDRMLRHSVVAISVARVAFLERAIP